MAWLIRASVVVVPLLLGPYSALGYFEDNQTLAPAIVLFVMIAILASLVAFRYLGRATSALPGAMATVLTFAIFAVGAFALIVPGLDRLRVSERAVADARQALSCADPKIAVVGFREPSILLVGGDTMRVLTAAQAGDFLGTGTCRAMLLDRRRQASFVQRIADLGLEMEVRGTAKGLNFGNLRPATLHVVMPKGSAR